MDTPTDRFTLWLLRSIASALLLGGISVLVAGVPVYGMWPDVPLVTAISWILLQLSVVSITAGGAALYLSRASAPPFPNERATIADNERPRVGGWLIALALVVVALPVWLLVQLQPFLREWAHVVAVLSEFDIWRGGSANMSGIVLVPLAAALAPPLLELATLVGFIFAPVLLLPRLFARSWRFPRAFIVCTLLLAALVIASGRGADAALLASDAAHQMIADSSANAEEEAQIRAIVSRYTAAVGSTAPVLGWAFGGYLVWVPGMFLSRKVRSTFADRARSLDSVSRGSLDVETITTPPPFTG